MTDETNLSVAIHINFGGRTRCIEVGGNKIQFKMHWFLGPEPIEDLGEDHPFWTAITLWAQQGQRVDTLGLCIYEEKK